MRNGWLWSVMADGWHPVQIPAGHGGWPPVGHGSLTLYDGGFSGGSTEVTDADDAAFGDILQRYALYERCLILCFAWYSAS